MNKFSAGGGDSTPSPPVGKTLNRVADLMQSLKNSNNEFILVMTDQNITLTFGPFTVTKASAVD